MDIEQLIIKDVVEYRAKKLSVPWPPKIGIEMAHDWGLKSDPLQLARPVWFITTIWWDVLYFGPFYLFAIYAFTFGKDWIRIPSLLYGVRAKSFILSVVDV